MSKITSVLDPYSFDPDPDPIRIQGFDDQKLKFTGIPIDQSYKKGNFLTRVADPDPLFTYLL